MAGKRPRPSSITGSAPSALKRPAPITDPDNTASQKALLHSGLKNVGEIELLAPTRHGELCAPLFRISRPELSA